MIRSETFKAGDKTSSKWRANSKSRDAVVETILVEMTVIQLKGFTFAVK